MSLDSGGGSGNSFLMGLLFRNLWKDLLFRKIKGIKKKIRKENGKE